MKIKKTPVKRLAIPPLPVRNLIKTLKECPQSEIAEHIEATPEWIWPRGDLFHWVGVLNRFDEILDLLCKSHDMKKPQPKEFSAEDRRLVLAILFFSRLLLESCTNRNLYASYEQLNDLLYTRDLDVLEATLRLLLRPAQRHSAQRSAKSIFIVSQDRLLALAHSWGNRELGMDLQQLADDTVEIPERLSMLNFQFFKTVTPSKPSPNDTTPPTTTSATAPAPSDPAASAPTTQTPHTPAKRRRSSTGGVSSSANTGSAPSGSNNAAPSTPSEGMVVIQLTNVGQKGTSDYEILKNLIQEYQIPEEHQFQLLNRIRIATGIRDPRRRLQLLTIRILAIAVMSHVLSEAIIIEKFFAFDPEVIQSLTELIHPDHKVPFSLQTVALFALDGLAHLRNKQTDVLTAINASASHGVLLYALRKVMSGLDSERAPYPQDFLDALFAFISYLVSTQTGGNMVISAGLVPILLQLLSNKHVSQLKNVTKSVSILDNAVYGFNTAFSSFCNSNGLDALVTRIKDEVDYSLELVREAEASKMTGVTITGEGTSKEEEVSPIPFERTALLKAMFKFALHMMQSPNQEGLRNLIDTTLPSTLKSIMENPTALGTAVYAHAINTMASFIHNEPTSLTILQEAKIPQTLLASLSKEIPASTDVVMNLPGAFGAMCLNPAGLEMLTKEFEMKKFFSIFTSIPHVRAFQDNDIASNLGVSMDELVRHQPSLKPIVMKEVVAMLHTVLKLCEPEVLPSEELVYSTLQKTRSKDAPALGEVTEEDIAKDDRKDSLVAQLIEGAARFCESFFQNMQSAKDFLKEDGINLFMKFYSLTALPYDLANTPAFFTLSHLLKLLSETNPAAAVTSVLREVNRVMVQVKPLLESTNTGSDLIQYIDITDSSEKDIAQGNEYLRALISLHTLSGLLSDMYCASTFSHGRNSVPVLAAFVKANGDEALESLGQLHRMCIWESIVMKQVLQKNWNDPHPRAKKTFNPVLIPGTIEENFEEPASEDKTMTTAATIDMFTPSAINTKYFKTLLTQIPRCITPMYQGIVKLLFHRRDFDSAQRANAFKIATSLSKVLQSNLSWKRIDAVGSSNDKFLYINTMLQLFPFLFLDERSPATLQTILVASFVKTGGLDTLFNLLESLWSEAKTIHSSTSTPEPVQKELLSKIHGAIESTLAVLQTLSSSKLLLDSSHTPFLTSKDDRNRKEDYFEPHEFLVDVRLAILPRLKALWMDKYLDKCPATVARHVIQITIHLLKAGGENKHPVSVAPPPAVVLGTVPTNLFEARPLVADPAGVATLLDMGFPRSAAELALTRCANQIERATEYLLTHQEVVAAAIYEQEREEAAARAAALATATATETEAASSSAAPAPTTGEASQATTDNPAPESSSDAVAENSAAPSNAGGQGNNDDHGNHDDEDEENYDDEDAEMLHQALQMSVGTASAVEAQRSTADESSSSSEARAAEDAAAAAAAAEKKEEEYKELFRIYKENKEKLTNGRDELKPLLVSRSLDLIESIDDIVFAVRDLLVLLCKERDSMVLSKLMDDMQTISKAHDTWTPASRQTFGTRLRLLALLFSDGGIQSKMADHGAKLVPMLTSILAEHVNSSAPQKGNTWLSPLLLMIECYVSLADEPRSVPDAASSDERSKVVEKNPMDGVFTPLDMQNMLQSCIALLKQEDLTKDIGLSVFRILVRLTRHHTLAMDFLKANGLDLMFSTLKPERIGVQGQQSFMIMIMRHIIEDSYILQQTMEKEIVRWFSQPSRSRTSDIQGFLRHNNYLGLRDMDAFIAGTLSVCKVAKYDASFRTLQLSLARNSLLTKPEDGKDLADSQQESSDKDKEKEKDKGKGLASAEASSSDGTAASATAAAITEASKKYSSEISETVIHFLVNELLSVRNPSSPATVATTATTASATPAASPLASSSKDTKPSSPTTSGTEKSDKDLAEVTHDANFVHRCFVLQCLNELLISYPSCKIDLMNFSRRKSGKDIAGQSNKPRTNWLSYLLNDLIPYRGTVTASTDAELRKHSIESNYASSVLVVMCSKSREEEEKKPFSELAQVRRFLVDGIIRSYKDAIASTDPVEIKYGKFLSLSELSYKILGSSPSAGPGARPSEDSSINIVKVMLEKNFIMTLTNVLADIDLNYPHAKILVNAVLKPLEHLTKLSLKMSRASDPGAPKVRRVSTPLSGTGSGAGSGDDAPDLYRNSSLGMFDGTNIESEEDGESGDSSGEDDIYEGEEYDEETASDASDLSEDDLSDDEEDEEDIEEAVERNPFHHHSHEISDDDENDDEDMADDDDDDDEDGDLDEEMEAELQEALDDEDDDDEEMETMEWDANSRPIILGEDDIDEVIDDDDDDDEDDDGDDDDAHDDDGQHFLELGTLGHHHHHHHHHHHEDDGLVDEDDEDDDEDDEDDDEEDGDEDEFDDNLLAESDGFEVRGGNRNGPWDMTSTFVINSNEGGLLNNAQLVDLRGRRPRMSHRRLDDRGFIWNESGAEHGRIPFIEDDDFPLLGSPARNPFYPTSDDAITHPLLSQPTNARTNPLTDGHRRGGSRNLGLANLQSFEGLLNGNASQVLGTLLNGGAIRAGHGAFRVEVNHGHSAVFTPVDRIGSHNIGSGDVITATISAGSSAENSGAAKRDMFSIVHDFIPYSTSQRWAQECRMMYGSSASEKAQKLVTHVVNALIPAAKEEMRLRAEREAMEQEIRRKAEAERKKAAEEKRKAEEEAERIKLEEEEKARLAEKAAAEESAAARRAEEAAARAARGETEEAPVATEDTAMEVEGATTTEQSGAPAEPEAPARRTVMIDGELVDITGSDIDPEFLEALPDDMRREVYNDYLQSQRSAAPAVQPATTSQAINSDFLDALPQNMRAELDELMRGQGGASSSTADPQMGLGDFSFSRLMPQLRQLYQAGTGLSSLMAETSAMLDHFPRHFPRLREARDLLAASSSAQAQAKKAHVQRDAIQLVDKSSLATLVRLMFLPQPLSKNILNKLLVNLCENSKTRSELLSLLLSILQDGGTDLAAVDKSFAQMSLRGKPIPKTHKGKSTSTPAPAPVSMDNVPNLVARRCFEALYYIVSFNSQAAIFFLTEHENVTLKKHSKKGKGKEKEISSKYPIVLLLDLLERPIFVENSALMEQLMTLLSVICRPLSTLSKDETPAKDEKAKAKDSLTDTPVSTAEPSTASAVGSSTADAATQEGSSTQVAGPAGASTSASASASSAAAGETAATLTESKTDAKTEPKTADSTEPALKPPVIPDHYIQLIVRVLTAGECSSKTFQFTLSVIQNLSALSGARAVITAELVRVARELGGGITENLDSLTQTLESAMSGVEVQGVALEKFSPASSKQAKLLRVLKTIDYMYSRKQTPQLPATTQNIELAPTVDPEEADAIMPRSMRDIHSGLLSLSQDEEKVTQIYDSLDFHSLWTKVGDTLEFIHERSDMVHVATVLLPLIESFMVVCKYVGLRPSTLEMDEEVCKATSNATEELFLQFTEKHSKILNIMVRNNPALMSGSFSLLVHNPKMLEFDNKRNYFTQQLHKRNPARDHYGTLQMNVRREMVFVDSFSYLQSRSGEEIKYSKLSVHFHGEEGVDAGGVTREWFQVLARQMFNPDYALFKTSAADKLTYQPNRASWVNSDHLLFFKFIGRIIGKAIYDGRLLDAYFTRSFYKHILGRPVDYRDVEAVDPEYYKSLVWMLENDITDIVDETFSVETDDFGNTRTVDLKPNGRNIPVTEENKHEYVKYITEQKLTLAIKDQIHSFLQGFHEIIPSHLISIFNEQELELLISGLPDIDVDEWKNNTEYQNYTPASPQIQNFWRAVRSFDQTERAKLLQFVTGTSKVPLGGFSQLQGISGVQKFQIHKDFSSMKRLPSAHTCFNQLDLPEYESYDDLRQQLLTAISECSTGFAFA